MSLCKWTDRMAVTHTNTLQGQALTAQDLKHTPGIMFQFTQTRQRNATHQHFTASRTFNTTAHPLPFKPPRAAAAIYCNTTIQHSTDGLQISALTSDLKLYRADGMLTRVHARRNIERCCLNITAQGNSTEMMNLKGWVWKIHKWNLSVQNTADFSGIVSAIIQKFQTSPESCSFFITFFII